jgi:hypothetical protein
MTINRDEKCDIGQLDADAHGPFLLSDGEGLIVTTRTGPLTRRIDEDGVHHYQVIIKDGFTVQG